MQHNTPSHPDHVARAYELLRLHHYDLALQEVERALALDPDHAAAHVCGAWVLREQRKFKEAETAARAALALDPELAAAHHVLAVLLWQTKRLPDAKRAFDAALALQNGDQALYMTNYARFLNAQGRYKEALEMVDGALTRAPFSSYAHEMRGAILQHTGRRAEAADAYRNVLRLDPRNADAHNKLGVIDLTEGRVNDALASFREALRLNPGDAAARANLVQGLKARNPFYGLVLSLTLRIGGSPGSNSRRWYTFSFAGLIIAGMALSRLNGALSTLLLQIWAMLFLVFMLLIIFRVLWHALIEPVFNTLLMLDPANRPVLDYDAADAATSAALGLGLLNVLLFGLVYAVVGARHPLAQLLAGLNVSHLLALLFSYMLRSVQGRLGKAIWFSYGLAVLGLYGAGLTASWQPFIFGLSTMFAAFGFLVLLALRMFFGVRADWARRQARRRAP